MQTPDRSHNILPAVRKHLKDHGVRSRSIKVAQVGRYYIIGLDGLAFGFIAITITGQYMDEIQYLYESVDLIMDQAIINGVRFEKSRRPLFKKEGITITLNITYEYKWKR